MKELLSGGMRELVVEVQAGTLRGREWGRRGLHGRQQGAEILPIAPMRSSASPTHGQRSYNASNPKQPPHPPRCKHELTTVDPHRHHPNLRLCLPRLLLRLLPSVHCHELHFSHSIPYSHSLSSIPYSLSHSLPSPTISFLPPSRTSSLCHLLLSFKLSHSLPSLTLSLL